MNDPIKSILINLYIELHNNSVELLIADYSILVTPFKVCNPGSASAIAAMH